MSTHAKLSPCLTVSTWGGGGGGGGGGAETERQRERQRQSNICAACLRKIYTRCNYLSIIGDEILFAFRMLCLDWLYIDCLGKRVLREELIVVQRIFQENFLISLHCVVVLCKYAILPHAILPHATLPHAILSTCHTSTCRTSTCRTSTCHTSGATKQQENPKNTLLSFVKTCKGKWHNLID